jgi:hypothetical protein
MLRQIVEDRLPRRLGAHVDVGTRPDARLVGQRTEGHVDELSLSNDREEERSADAAANIVGEIAAEFQDGV